jgi:hypothetical protein
MAEITPSDPNERSFSELVEPGVRELRRQRGPCPSSEALVAFHERRLSAEESARVRDHVEICGLCDVQLGRLEAAQESLSRRLSQGIRAFLLKPVVPYGIVTLLLYPAYRGFVHPTQDPAIHQQRETEFGVAPVPSYSLNVVRSDSQARGSPVIHLSGEERFFLLSFFIPMKSSPSYHYDVVVVRSDQTPIVPSQALSNCNEVGDCFLVCNPVLFSPGPYELRVTENTAAASKGIPPFHFRITR